MIQREIDSPQWLKWDAADPETRGKEPKRLGINPEWRDPNAIRVTMDSIRWRLAKMLPSMYGDRSELALTGTGAFRPSDNAPSWLADVAAKPKPNAPAPEPDAASPKAGEPEAETIH